LSIQNLWKSLLDRIYLNFFVLFYIERIGVVYCFCCLLLETIENNFEFIWERISPSFLLFSFTFHFLNLIITISLLICCRWEFFFSFDFLWESEIECTGGFEDLCDAHFLQEDFSILDNGILEQMKKRLCLISTELNVLCVSSPFKTL